MRCRVFFTRNGKVDGAWDLYEERDETEQAGRTDGLEGENDLLAAVGVFGSVEFGQAWMFGLGREVYSG